MLVLVASHCNTLVWQSLSLREQPCTHVGRMFKGPGSSCEKMMARCEALGQIVFPCCVLYSHGNQKDVRSVTSANQHIRPLTQLRLLVQFCASLGKGYGMAQHDVKCKCGHRLRRFLQLRFLRVPPSTHSISEFPSALIQHHTITLHIRQ